MPLWYRVSRWSVEPVQREIVRETDHMLFATDGKRFLKRDSNGAWYPTLEAAQEVITNRQAHKARQKADQRVRNAAPELLEALDNLIIGIGMGWDLEGLIEAGKSAIAKAEASK